MAGFRKFTVSEYHKLIEVGVLTEDDNLELLEGYLVHKMSRNPPHDGTIQMAVQAVTPALPSNWCIRVQSAVTLIDSEPEPDVSVVQGNVRSYLRQHPTIQAVGTLIEVADSTLPGDRNDKGRIYARASVPIYWIINLVDNQVEVYELPSGPTATPAFGKRTDYQIGDLVPLVLNGHVVARIAASELLP